jgi:Zn-dependent peptidase ImmA (M78 family)
VTQVKASRDPEKRARQVLTELAITRYPVDVDHIARTKGIAVHFLPLEEDLSGMIFTKKAATIIVVNSLHHANRQRFTLAHELGHFELHMTEIGSGVHVDKRFLAFARNAKSSMGWDRREIEANRFARELLVPHRMLLEELHDRVVDAEDERLITEMAGRFQVSRQMMTFRISDFVASGSSQPRRWPS